MKLAEILTGPETWTKGAYSRNGQFCLAGAIGELVKHEQNRGTLMECDLPLLREWHRAQVIIGTPAIERWNDDKQRTWDEVASYVDAYDRDRLLHP